MGKLVLNGCTQGSWESMGFPALGTRGTTAGMFQMKAWVLGMTRATLACVP